MSRTPGDRWTLSLLIVLTFSTGMVDAIGFLGLDNIFAGNMTGNVVIIGMAIGGGDLPIVGPALALVGFMAGAAGAGLALRCAPAAWTRATTVLFALTGLVLGAAGLVFMLDQTPTRPVELVVSASLGIAMGIQAATARVLAVADVTTVVVTSTIVGLMADQFATGKRTRQGRRLVAVIAMAGGAVAGALLLQLDLGVALIFSSVLTLGVTLVGALVVGRRSSVLSGT